MAELIANDADLAPITSTGTTPLMLACGRGHLKVAGALLAEQNGESADVEARDAQGQEGEGGATLAHEQREEEEKGLQVKQDK